MPGFINSHGSRNHGGGARASRWASSASRIMREVACMELMTCWRSEARRACNSVSYHRRRLLLAMNGGSGDSLNKMPIFFACRIPLVACFKPPSIKNPFFEIHLAIFDLNHVTKPN